jgi:hypothetical protein
MRGGLKLYAGQTQSDEASPAPELLPELLPLLLPASVPPSMPPPELLPLLDAEPLLDPLLDAEPLLEPLLSSPASLTPELLPLEPPDGPPDDDELQPTPPTAVMAPSAKVSPAIASTCNFIGLSFSCSCSQPGVVGDGEATHRGKALLVRDLGSSVQHLMTMERASMPGPPRGRVGGGLGSLT